MKELSIEGKAKRYDEALERAMNVSDSEWSSPQALSEYIFPELKKSEDKNIRKELIAFLKETIENVGESPNIWTMRNAKKWLAWLEKVGEIVDYYEDKLDKCACDYFYKGYKKALEKKGGITKLSEEEQNRFAKSVLTSCAMSFIDYLDAHKYEGKMCVSNGECEDIENAFQNAMWDRLYRYYCKYIEKQGEHLENYNEAEKEKAEFVGDGFIECHADFLDFKKGNTYWLEYIGDDKYNVRSDNLLGKTYHITPCQLYTVFKKLTWLEKQGEQKPAAWSEEDVLAIERIIDTIQCAQSTRNGKPRALYTDEILDNLVNWLKSLRPQNRWKPSEEQMVALDGICSYIRNKADWEISQDMVSGLYKLSEQLKKLKEG